MSPSIPPDHSHGRKSILGGNETLAKSGAIASSRKHHGSGFRFYGNSCGSFYFITYDDMLIANFYCIFVLT
jgi:hypothetical protein